MSKTQPAPCIRYARGLFKGAFVLVLVASLVVAGLGASPAVASSELREHMAVLVNADRAAAGRHPVEVNARLTRLATHHSRRMAERRALYHSARLRSGMSECVGTGPTLARIERAFMNSAPHRRAILDRRAHKIGVGVVKQGRRLWVTLLFLR